MWPCIWPCVCVVVVVVVVGGGRVCVRARVQQTSTTSPRGPPTEWVGGCACACACVCTRDLHCVTRGLPLSHAAVRVEVIVAPIGSIPRRLPTGWKRARARCLQPPRPRQPPQRVRGVCACARVWCSDPTTTTHTPKPAGVQGGGMTPPGTAPPLHTRPPPNASANAYPTHVQALAEPSGPLRLVAAI